MTTSSADRPVGLPSHADEERKLPAWIENSASDRFRPSALVRDLWTYRELGIVFALSTLRVRYKQAAFGVAWAVLQPLLAAIIFSIVFGRLAGLSSDGMPYPVFNYSAMILWLYVSLGVAAAAQSLVENRDLITKVYFARPVAPLSAAFPGLVDLAIAFVVLVGMLVVYGVTPSWAVVLTPLWVVAAMLVVVAAGFPLSALNVRYRDVRLALPLVLQLWLFASPVVYSSSLVEGGVEVRLCPEPDVDCARRLPLVDRRRAGTGTGGARLGGCGRRRPRRRPLLLRASRALVRGRGVT